MGEKEENKVKVIFVYEVSDGNQEEYLKVTRETIKPFWKSHGCQSYSVWQGLEQPSTFVKEMVFQDVGEMKRVMALDEANSVKELFYKYASNVSRKVCIQKV